MPTAAQRKKGVTTQKFDSCIEKTKAKGVKNPYAVCNSAMNKKKSKK